jgi:hypothetical protein
MKTTLIFILAGIASFGLSFIVFSEIDLGIRQKTPQYQAGPGFVDEVTVPGGQSGVMPGKSFFTSYSDPGALSRDEAQ